MQFDFTTLPDRHGRDALAVDFQDSPRGPRRPKEGFDLIPMWVADMNFATVPTVAQAMIDRARHPLYG